MSPGSYCLCWKALCDQDSTSDFAAGALVPCAFKLCCCYKREPLKFLSYSSSFLVFASWNYCLLWAERLSSIVFIQDFIEKEKSLNQYNYPDKHHREYSPEVSLALLSALSCICPGFIHFFLKLVNFSNVFCSVDPLKAAFWQRFISQK